ncbi:hypothetical protein P7K49_034004 [Saguinus oedipus]|uniref:Uncharacterized protein n=1 Tax=Saguinus oedipus TaxID=9490 RepID=A0ABQ9TTI0_SAGOE|nr:hypothetical protein P7K49_034004 [Saguinus oedipus]
MEGTEAESWRCPGTSSGTLPSTDRDTAARSSRRHLGVKEEVGRVQGNRGGISIVVFKQLKIKCVGVDAAQPT